jgi:hypothetical protein
MYEFKYADDLSLHVERRAGLAGALALTEAFLRLLRASGHKDESVKAALQQWLLTYPDKGRPQ